MESDDGQLPPIPKAKPNIPTKPTFLKNQQFNKAGNTKLMLITNKDGNLSVITNTESPPIAPKPKSTFHLRVQQHGRKLQVCPIGHYVTVQSNTSKELDVCSVQRKVNWNTSHKKATKKNALEESCKIDLSEKVVDPLAVVPIPSPRKWYTKPDNVINTDQANVEGRNSFESIRANFESANMHPKPVPSPRGHVNVKLQRRLFEKLLCSKEKEEEPILTDKPHIHVDQTIASDQVPRKIPKSILPRKTKLSSKTFTRKMASRQSKTIPSKPNSKPGSRNSYPDLTPKPSINIPPESISKPSFEALSSVLATKPLLSENSLESAKPASPKPSPKPSPRQIPSVPHSKPHSPVLTCKGSPVLAPKPMPRSIPLEPTSRQLPSAIPQVIPTKQSSKAIPSNMKSKDIPSENFCKPTDSLLVHKKHAKRSVSAKHDIPKIIISDEENINRRITDQDANLSPVYIHCKHLENLIIESEHNNLENTNECIEKNDVTPDFYMDDRPETSTVVKPETSPDLKLETSPDLNSETSQELKSETTPVVKPEPSADLNQETYMNLESETYTDLILEPDRNAHPDEEPDDSNDYDYVNYDHDDYINCNPDDDKDHYINGDFSNATPSGEYMDFENTSDVQSDVSDRDIAVASSLTATGRQDHTYINCDIASDIANEDHDARTEDSSGSVDDLPPSIKNSGNPNEATGSECYEVILNVSSLKSPASKKYRRFSCRQPGKRRKSNFKKQSHLNIEDVDDGSDYKSSQEDVTELSNNELFEQIKTEEEVIGYTKDEFVDEEEEDEGWQSVDSSELDHDEENRKRSFHHVLSITPEPAESGVSSGQPSPCRLSSVTSESQLVRINSGVSFISSDGFEDGSVRSSISQFSLSDELEGINTCDSFEEDDLTDNELLEIMKRESTLSDNVPELDMEALKNDTMLHINKMRQKLAEMKRNVAHKNRPCVSLVSNDGLYLSDKNKQSENTVDHNKQDINKRDSNNVPEYDSGKECVTKRKLKEISWKKDVSNVSNYNRMNSSNLCHSIGSAENIDDYRSADSQGNMNNLNLKSLLENPITELHGNNQIRLGTTKHNCKIDYSKAMKKGVLRQSTVSDSSGNYDHIRLGRGLSVDSTNNDSSVSDNYDHIRVKRDDRCNMRFRNSKTRTSRGGSMDYEDLDAWTKLSLDEQADFLKRESVDSHDYEDVYHLGNKILSQDLTFYTQQTVSLTNRIENVSTDYDEADSGIVLSSSRKADADENCDYEYISGDESQLEAPTLPPRGVGNISKAPELPPPLVLPRKNVKRVRSRRSVRRRPSRRLYGRRKGAGMDETGPQTFRKRSQHVTKVDRSLAAQKYQHIKKCDDPMAANRCCIEYCKRNIETCDECDTESKYISIIYHDNEESEDDDKPLPMIPYETATPVVIRRPRSGSVAKICRTLAAVETTGNMLRERSFSEGTMRRGIRRKLSDNISSLKVPEEEEHKQGRRGDTAVLRRDKFAKRTARVHGEESVESAIYISAELDDETENKNSRRLSMDSYVDPDELTATPRHEALKRMENRTSWLPGVDGAPPVPPRTPSLKVPTPNTSIHKTHSSGPVLQNQSKRSKRDLQLRRQSRFVRKEPLFQAYNKDAKLRDTLHFTGKRKQPSVDRDSPPPLPPPRRQSSVTPIPKTSQHAHLITPERRSMSFPEIDVENVNRKPSLKMQRTLWCEVPEVVESGILDQIDDKARKLQEAMFEVITSEASYLRSLDIFVNNFHKADVFHTSYGLLRKEERHHLFSNLLSVRDASERLLLDLEDRFQENFMISDVCDIIIKHATQRNFDMYVTYCLNNQYQIKTLKSLKENPIFVTELGILERGKECGGNNLPSFIMMPFQRITRLPLLIEAIITRLEPGSDKIGTATEALNLVKKVAMKCNEEARRMEGIEELTKLAHKLDYKPNIKAIKISDKLLIVKRGDLQWFSHDTSRFNKKKVVSKQIHILVFADKVVLTKRKVKNDREVFEVFDWCPRNLVDVKSVELKYDTLPEEYKNVMMVVFLQNHEKKEKKYFINTTSDANFQRWSDALAPPNRSDQGESIYESWDCPQVMCTKAYNAQEPDELTMEESDVVDVLRKSEGWWEGMRVRDSGKGWFPANHVHEIVNDHVRARNLKHRYKVLSVCQEQLEKLQMQGKDLAF